MAELVVIDSNIFIGLLRRGIDPIVELGNWAGPRDLVTCGMIRLEVLRGLRSKHIYEGLSHFLDVMIQVPTSSEIWRNATEIARQLDRNGHVIPAADAIIAASALSIGASILTDDKHFDHCPALIVYRPELELTAWKTVR